MIRGCNLVSLVMDQNWTSVQAELHGLLRQNQSLPQDSRILVAFSGGQDSLCLLRLLLDLQSKWNWAIATIYCDHRWPTDSGKNADHVAQISKQWNLEHFHFIAPRVLKGEAEGRDWRYEIMTDCAQAKGYDYLVTAHTASDRAETLLYNLIRGSGMDGLQALSSQRRFNQSVTLVRPILHLTRVQTGQFCADHQLPIWDDGMNQDLHYRRNRIRLEVLPYLREHFNPQVDRAIAQTSELLSADVAYLEQQAQQLLDQVSPDTHKPCLDRQNLGQAPIALQRRAIRMFLQRHLGHAPNFAQVQKIMTLTKSNHRDRTDPLLGGIIAVVYHQQIILHDLNDPSRYGESETDRN